MVLGDTDKSCIQFRGSATVVLTMMENMWKLQKLPIYSGIKNQYHIIDYKGSAYSNISIINREDH